MSRFFTLFISTSLIFLAHNAFSMEGSKKTKQKKQQEEPLTIKMHKIPMYGNFVTKLYLAKKILPGTIENPTIYVDTYKGKKPMDTYLLLKTFLAKACWSIEYAKEKYPCNQNKDACKEVALLRTLKLKNPHFFEPVIEIICEQMKNRGVGVVYTRIEDADYKQFFKQQGFHTVKIVKNAQEETDTKKNSALLLEEFLKEKKAHQKINCLEQQPHFIPNLYKELM